MAIPDDQAPHAGTALETPNVQPPPVNISSPLAVDSLLLPHTTSNDHLPRLNSNTTPAPTERHIVLDHYAHQVIRRAEALDVRSRNLHHTEHNLAHMQAKYQERQRQLDNLETAMRKEMTAFLDDIAERQRKLNLLEQKQNECRVLLRNRVSTVHDLLVEVKSVSHSLQLKKSELRGVSGRLVTAQNEVAHAENALHTLALRMEEEESRAKRLAEEKAKLESAAAKIEQFEKSIQRRQTDLAEREQLLQGREARAEHFLSLEAVVGPLRQFLLDYDSTHNHESDIAATQSPILAMDPTAVAQRALVVLKEMRTWSKSLEILQTKLEDAKKIVHDRERRVGEVESSLRIREASLMSRERTLTLKHEDIRRQQTDADATLQSSEESRRECDAREDNLRSREAEMLEKERNVLRKEANAQQAQKSLAQREKSIRKAHAAVTAREKALDERQNELITLRQSIESMEKTLALKEDMLETQDFELTAREARRRTDTGSENHASVRRGGNSSSSRLIETNLQMSHVRNRSEAITMQAGRSESLSGDRDNPEVIAAQEPPDSQPNHRVQEQSSIDGKALPGGTQERRELPMEEGNAANAVPETATVRRHLAFDSSIPEISGDDRTAAEGRRIFRQTPLQEREDGSETAADELLPELIGARSLWKERVLRLEAVVESMRETTRATRPHLQPVLTAVADSLSAIRLEITSGPSQSDDLAKARFVEEQRAQIRWADDLRHQLDAVRDIQAGMLMALNKEDDKLPARPFAWQTAMSNAGEESNTASSRGNREDGGSVEGTLDVTATGRYMDFLEDTEDVDTFTSFRRFRANMQEQTLPREGDRSSGDLELAESRIFLGSGARHGLGLNRTLHLKEVPQVESRHNGTPNILDELASLRNELQSIASHRDREPSPIEL